MGTVRSFALLTNGAFARELRRGWPFTIAEHLALPIAGVWFFELVGTDLTRGAGWPPLAIGVIVWLLFVNGVTRSGMAVWDERRVVDGGTAPPWLLVASAAVVPATVFVLQLVVLELALTVDSAPYSVATLELVVPGALALASGIGCGLLVACLLTVHRRFALLIPVLLIATFALSPVVYPRSSLEGAGDTWCAVNSVCAATELARADIADAPMPVTDLSEIVAIGVGVALLSWGLFAARRRRPRFAADSAADALLLSGVSTGVAATDRRTISEFLASVAGALGFARARFRSTQSPGLRDVDLRIAAGEIVTVVGAPRSGQAALLRIAAGWDWPDDGRMESNGGVASLIDARVGFHSALSARSNLELRALIEGLSRHQARAVADDALRFVELSARADVLVREYDDEEWVRLAFGAATFLRRRVVVWDDELLLPHPDFRQVCLTRIPTLLSEGRSVLMASDDGGKLGEISERSVWLDDGRIRLDSSTGTVLEALWAPRVSPGPVDPSGDFPGAVRLADVHLLTDDGEPATAYEPGDAITVALELEAKERIEHPYLMISLAGDSGSIASANMLLDANCPAVIDAGLTRIDCRFEAPVLTPRHPFTVRFTMYASDRMTVLYPKRVIGAFVTGGTAAASGFDDERTEGRILGSISLLATYTWRIPGMPDRRFGPASRQCG